MGIRTALTPFGGKKEPFKRDEVLYQIENNEITAELPAGVYYLAITGGGGTADSSVHVSKLIIDDVEMIVCNSGASTWWGHNGGPGGTLTVNPALEVIETIKASNGNPGSGSVQGLGTGGASTSSYGWGAGTNVPAGQKQTGGALLKYLRPK